MCIELSNVELADYLRLEKPVSSYQHHVVVHVLHSKRQAHQQHSKSSRISCCQFTDSSAFTAYHKISDASSNYQAASPLSQTPSRWMALLSSSSTGLSIGVIVWLSIALATVDVGTDMNVGKAHVIGLSKTLAATSVGLDSSRLQRRNLQMEMHKIGKSQVRSLFDNTATTVSLVCHLVVNYLRLKIDVPIFY
jgi:hypothetical protein